MRCPMRDGEDVSSCAHARQSSDDSGFGRGIQIAPAEISPCCGAVRVVSKLLGKKPRGGECDLREVGSGGAARAASAAPGLFRFRLRARRYKIILCVYPSPYTGIITSYSPTGNRAHRNRHLLFHNPARGGVSQVLGILHAAKELSVEAHLEGVARLSGGEVGGSTHADLLPQRHLDRLGQHQEDIRPVRVGLRARDLGLSSLAVEDEELDVQGEAAQLAGALDGERERDVVLGHGPRGLEAKVLEDGGRREQQIARQRGQLERRAPPASERVERQSSGRRGTPRARGACARAPGSTRPMRRNRRRAAPGASPPRR